MLRKILLGAAAVVALFAAFVLTRPSTYTVERAATVAAPPAVVFAQLVDFQRWKAWSPWERLDPGMSRTFGGEPGAVGSTYAWSGNEDVGKGRMTVKEARPGERVGIDLEFIEPFPSRADTTFALAPDGAGTRVTWTMSGGLGFLEKAMCVFMPMDRMIGPDFERGLAQLRSAAEAEAARLQPAAATR